MSGSTRTWPDTVDGGPRHRLTHNGVRAAAIVAVIGAVGVVALIYAVTQHVSVARVDPHIQQWVPAHRSPLLTALARGFTTFGSEVTVVVVTLVAAAALYVRRRLDEVVVLLVGMAGSVALIFVLKHLVARHRPPAAQMFGTIEHGYSFPSGHTLDGTVLAALLIWCFLWPRANARTWRVCLIGLELVVAAGVAASRLYFDVHWGTDVLGSWLVAMTWLAVLRLGVNVFEEPAHRFLREASAR